MESKMSKIKAVIKESNDGAYYNVLLSAVPRKDEKITLYSHLDRSTGHQAIHDYIVLDITHDIHDVTEKVAKSNEGFHEVTILAKRC